MKILGADTRDRIGCAGNAITDSLDTYRLVYGRAQPPSGPATVYKLLLSRLCGNLRVWDCISLTDVAVGYSVNYSAGLSIWDW
jgi:hypothetical protein